MIGSEKYDVRPIGEDKSFQCNIPPSTGAKGKSERRGKRVAKRLFRHGARLIDFCSPHCKCIDGNLLCAIASCSMPPRLISLFGLVVIVACAWALSSDRRRFPWRTALWGLGLQFVFALFILKT